MIKKRHAIRTEDESIWIDFDGDVPRDGDLVYHDEKNFCVYKVEWFIRTWRIESFPSENHDTTTISQARVFIREIEKE